MPSRLDLLIDQALSRRREAGRLRNRREIRSIDATHVEIAGKRCVHFCSNDYLGLSHHPRVIEAAAKAAVEWGTGSGGSGLIGGYSPAHAAAERAIAEWKKVPAAVLLPSGYQANHAAIQALAGIAGTRDGVRFLLDKLVHASLLDAVASVGSPWRIFPHNGLEKLRRLLADSPEGQIQVVVTESIFSMDGDSADLAGLSQLKREIPFVLLLDEAHGGGVYGPTGNGWAAEAGYGELADVSIVTLSKAAGCMGGAICGSENLRNAVVNFGRAYIYSTSISPAIAAAITAAVEVIVREPDRRLRVRGHARRLRTRLMEAGVQLASEAPIDSPIIPVILGTESAAMEQAVRLLEGGGFVQAIRPPTVARGTSRLRISVSSEHSGAEVEQLVKTIIRQGGDHLA